MEKTFVICVDHNDYHTDDALPVACDFCGCGVWISPHNIDKAPICIRCMMRLAARAGAEINFSVSQLDMDRAVEELKKIYERNHPKS